MKFYKLKKPPKYDDVENRLPSYDETVAPKPSILSVITDFIMVEIDELFQPWGYKTEIFINFCGSVLCIVFLPFWLVKAILLSPNKLVKYLMKTD